MNVKIKLFLIVCCALINGCTNNIQVEETNASDTYSIKHNGIDRTFIVNLPKNYDDSKKYSLCFIFHGGNGNAELMVDKKFTEKAGNLDFIMVYPNGIDGKWDFKKKGDNVPGDVEFISILVDYFESEYSIDSNRIYAGGVSMGGVMAYSLAANIPERFSAISAVSSTAISLNKVSDIKPVSILHIHAKDDLVIPYDKAGYGALHSINKWKIINQSEDESQVFLNKNGIYGEKWVSSETGKVISLISNETGGHGALPFTVDMILDFFYNNPPRENRISLDFSSVESYYTVNKEVKIDLEIEEKDSIKELFYLVNGKIVDNISDIPTTFKWIPDKEGKYKINACAVLNDGTKIYSAISLDLLVLKPFSIGKYITEATSVENRLLQPSNITDGDLTTRWASKYSDNQEILIDLKETKEISGLSIIWEDAYAESYFIDLSADGKTWLTQKISKIDNNPDFLNFTSTKCRYLKLRGDKRATNWGYSIYEILIH